MLTPEQSAQQRQKQGLILARRHVLQQLEAAQNSRHRQMLEAAIADLDAQISRLS
jgi:transposase